MCRIIGQCWIFTAHFLCGVLAAILKMADISKIFKTQNCSSNGDLSPCQILCLYHYSFRSYQHISTPFHMWVDYDVPNWFLTSKNFYWSPFSKCPPQYRTNLKNKLKATFEIEQCWIFAVLWWPFWKWRTVEIIWCRESIQDVEIEQCWICAVLSCNYFKNWLNVAENLIFRWKSMKNPFISIKWCHFGTWMVSCFIKGGEFRRNFGNEIMSGPMGYR
jgi:hypothetical protein